MSTVSPFDIVIFGGSGDLAMRKLLPALYQRFRDGALGQQGRILAAALEELDRNTFLERASAGCRQHARVEFDAGTWAAFSELLDYIRLDATREADFAALGQRLSEHPDRIRLFYLSTGPDLFSQICSHLGSAGLVNDQARVVLEKPLGHDLATATRINEQVGEIFSERQIYRIDHYLGKETVQNLIALRFGNAFLEPLWNRGNIDSVQITLAEQVGVDGRGRFYDRTGALRDMVQNHLLQLLCIVAMDAPTSVDADAVRDEKLKVLRALRPMRDDDVLNRTVRGQYKAGAIASGAVPGYTGEEGVAADSITETFVALKAEIDTWRWAGVPFYLRTGKRMQERVAEVVINFRAVPHSIFDENTQPAPNRLVITLQPKESVELHLMAKAPGDDMRLRPVTLDLDFQRTFTRRPADAYERLLMDCLRGRLTLFMRRDEVDAAWRWIEPILEAWEHHGTVPKRYTAGTWGPAASSALIGRAGHAWHEEI